MAGGEGGKVLLGQEPSIAACCCAVYTVPDVVNVRVAGGEGGEVLL